MSSKTGQLTTAGTDFVTLSGGLNVDAVSAATSPLQNCNQVTFITSGGSVVGAGVQFYLKTPGGTWDPVGVIDGQTGAFVGSGTISPPNGATKSWSYTFTPGSFIDAKVALNAITSGPVTVEINAGSVPTSGAPASLTIASLAASLLTGALNSSQTTQLGSSAVGAVLGAFREEGNIAVGAGNPIAQNGADTTDDILWGCQIPANVFDVAFRQLSIAFQGQTGATANNKRFKLFVNPTMAGQTVSAAGIISGGTVTAGTPICDSGTWTATNNNVAFQGGAQITKYGAGGSNTQMTGQVFAILGSTHGGAQAGQALTLPENAVINIVITGSSYTTGAAGDVKLQTATVTGSN
ncbi:MAG: hypothetical protein JWO38_412 [Gemmataceae bacterium]|nr:hypothetical protein [Gemmataceae bacterium]